MDTGSHLLFGATLAGLATIDPVVAAHPEVAHAVMAGTLLGSHAPDFDSVMRLRGEAAYIRHHRGLTHSLPAPFIWAVALGLPLAWAFGASTHAFTVVIWTLIAVCLHIGLDLLNAYGVQCLRPFSGKWWHLDALCLFDPYLFALHGAAALVWLAGWLPPAPMFAAVYALSALYIGWRLIVRRRTLRRIRRYYGTSGKITLVPSLSGRSWQYVAETEDAYLTGRVSRGAVVPEARLDRSGPDRLPKAARVSMDTDGVRAFLHFAERVHVHVQEKLDGYEVTWSDVRFWHDHKLPFGASVTLDTNMNVLRDRIGWNKKSWEPPHV
jgi:inner membrane protein